MQLSRRGSWRGEAAAAAAPDWGTFLTNPLRSFQYGADLGHKIAEPRPWPRNADQEASSIRQHAVMSSRWSDIVLAPSKDVRAGISATSGTPARQWEKRKEVGRKAHGVGVRACGLEG